MKPKPDIEALTLALEVADREFIEAKMAKENAVTALKAKWQVAAAACSRLRRAQAKAELAKMRAGDGYSGGSNERTT